MVLQGTKPSFMITCQMVYIYAPLKLTVSYSYRFIIPAVMGLEAMWMLVATLL